MNIIMKACKTYKRFEATVIRWEKELEQYSIEVFTQKTNPQTWSIGQVYEHITNSTLNFHVKQIEACLVSNSNKDKGKTFIGWLSLFIKRIPPIEIQIPPEENFEPLQPEGKQVIKERLNDLKKLFSQLSIKIDASKYKGKTNHPGMGYLSAADWFEVIEMHFRYHERDKRRIIKLL